LDDWGIPDCPIFFAKFFEGKATEYLLKLLEKEVMNFATHIAIYQSSN
jgi:hypothetical protein